MLPVAQSPAFPEVLGRRALLHRAPQSSYGRALLLRMWESRGERVRMLGRENENRRLLSGRHRGSLTRAESASEGVGGGGQAGDVARAGLGVEDALGDGATDMGLGLPHGRLCHLGVSRGDGLAGPADEGADGAAHVPVARGTALGLSNPLLGGSVSCHCALQNVRAGTGYLALPWPTVKRLRRRTSLPQGRVAR